MRGRAPIVRIPRSSFRKGWGPRVAAPRTRLPAHEDRTIPPWSGRTTAAAVIPPHTARLGGWREIPAPPPPPVVAPAPPPPPPVVIPAPPLELRANRREALIRTRGSRLLLTLCLALGLAHAAAAQQTVTAPHAGAPANVPEWCAAAAAVGLTNVQCPPYNAAGNGAADDTGALQRAIDASPGIVQLPPGTYLACQLMLRNSATVFRGSGKNTTRLRCTAGCTNLLNTNPPAPAPVQQGPNTALLVADLTLEGPCTGTLFATNARDLFNVTVTNVGFDLATANGMIVAAPYSRVLNSEFYSSSPGKGGVSITVQRGAHNALISGNTFKWIRTGIQIGDLASITTPVTENVTVSQNQFDGGFYALPVKVAGIDTTLCLGAGHPLACCTGAGTGSCGTGAITYAAGTMTDTGASFTGLCGDTGTPGACGATTRNQIRVMVPRVTTSTATTGYFRSNVITDAATNFVAAGVRRGDLVRSTNAWCTGNGSLGDGARSVCSGAAGGGRWGDRCLCTAAADCSSGVCEKRFATVVGVENGTHDVEVDEWTSDTTRRPVGPPYDGPAGAGVAGGNVTIFSWSICSIASYTATSITCDAQTGSQFRDWTGAAVVPAAGTQYEIMTFHGLYNHQALAGTVRERFMNNIVQRGWADQIQIGGTDNIVSANTIMDGWDFQLNVQGQRSTITNNVVVHGGTHGIGLVTNAGNVAADHVVANNVSIDTPWIGLGGGAHDCPYYANGTRNVFQHNVAGQTGLLATSLSGYCLTDVVDETRLVGNRCTGTFGTACYRLDAATVTNTHFSEYDGAGISNAGGTFSIEGGRTTQALGTANAAQNGSYFGCTDCTVANPCAAAGTGAFAKRQGGAWVCN
jgi:hypothetical protein